MTKPEMHNTYQTSRRASKMQSTMLHLYHEAIQGHPANLLVESDIERKIISQTWKEFVQEGINIITIDEYCEASK